MRKSFVLYLDYSKYFGMLSMEERGQLITALFDYQLNGSDSSLSPAAEMAFCMMRDQLDRDATKYEKKCQMLAENGRKGGRPKNQMVFEKSNCNQIESDNDILSPLPPQEGTSVLEKKFEQFWDKYPKKRKRDEAMQAFIYLNPDKDLISHILYALDKQKQSEQWKQENGRYIPSPDKYTKEKQWETVAREYKDISVEEFLERISYRMQACRTVKSA